MKNEVIAKKIERLGGVPDRKTLVAEWPKPIKLESHKDALDLIDILQAVKWHVIIDPPLKALKQYIKRSPI